MHVFQECKTRSPVEGQLIEPTFLPRRAFLGSPDERRAFVKLKAATKSGSIPNGLSKLKFRVGRNEIRQNSLA